MQESPAHSPKTEDGKPPRNEKDEEEDFSKKIQGDRGNGEL